MLEKSDIVLFQGKAKSGKTTRAIIFAARALKHEQNIIMYSDNLNVPNKIFEILCTTFDSSYANTLIEKRFILLSDYCENAQTLKNKLLTIESQRSFCATFILIDDNTLVNEILNCKKDK